MKITDRIELKIDRPKGYVFTYSDIFMEVHSMEAVIKALKMMVQSSRISKLSKGKYYKPETTPFGNLLPAQKKVVIQMF